ncbi:hypothetical protein ECDEC2C_5544 [Escherichia coli DEC2C]|nr:hypothetical protein ECDEC2C_5544 [Escherichia coli DEC2C]
MIVVLLPPETLFIDPGLLKIIARRESSLNPGPLIITGMTEEKLSVPITG